MDDHKINAKVATLREVLTELNEIDVPWYQRTYKWGQEQVDDIFHDVVFYAWDSGPRGAFLGSIVFAPGEKKGAWEIIDGQQRVTTLTVLLSVLAHTLKDIAPASSKIKEVFTLLNRTNGSPRLQPKEIDLAIYTEIVSEYRSGVLLKYEQDDKNAIDFLANNLLFKAYEHAQKMVDGAVSEACRERKITRQIATEQLIYSLLDAVRLVRILAPDNSDGIKIFESLNASGMPLEEDELIKSCFYMHAKSVPDAKNRVQSLWEGTRSISTLFTTSSKRAKFLRSFWLSNHHFVRKDGLFDAYNVWIQGAIIQPNASTAFSEICKQIDQSMHVYHNMEKAANGFEFIKVQNSMGAIMFRTVLLSVHDLMADSTASKRIESIRRVGYVLESVLVRMSIAGQTTNVLEKSVSDLSLKIRHGEFGFSPDTITDGVKTFFKQQHLAIPSDQLFETAFVSSAIDGTKPKKWIPIFYRLNCALKFPNAIKALYKDDPDYVNWRMRRVREPFESPSQSHCKDLGFKGINDYLSALSSPGNYVLDIDDEESPPVNGNYSQRNADAEGILKRNTSLAELAVKVWPLFD